METTNMAKKPDLDELLNSLPACRRCRANKRRCDTLLPSCHNCAKANVECVFFDHVLGEDLPRSYIVSLVQCLENSQVAGSPRETRTGGLAIIPPGVQRPELAASNTHTMPRYLGRLSALSQSLQIIGDESIPEPTSVNSLCPYQEFESDLIVKGDMHRFLLKTYFTELHPLYPFLDESLPFLSPDHVQQIETRPQETYILQMVYAIACHCVPGERSRLLPLSDACHHRALRHVDSATADSSPITLQAIMLMALYSLFEPTKGNFGQLIGFAARLGIDLGSHDTPDRETTMRNVQTSIYCMENQFSTGLDRPSFFPEPVRHIEFDIGQPSEYLCSLYRIQSKYRNNESSEYNRLVESLDTASLEWQVSRKQISPNILSAVYETQLLLNPKPAIAARLLNSYNHPRSIHTFLTPQWTYRAGLILLEDQYSQVLSHNIYSEAYGTCLVLLDRMSSRWQGASALSESITSYVRAKNGI